MLRMIKMIQRFSAVAMVMLVGICGCSSKPEDGISRVAVNGKVSLDGQPLESGYVTFTPQGDGPSAGGEIKSGQYAIDAGSGPSVGQYRVEIRSMIPTGRKIPNYDGAPGEMMEETYNQIPPNYNTRSELTVEVKPDSTHDFNLQGKLLAPQPGAQKKTGRNR